MISGIPSAKFQLIHDTLIMPDCHMTVKELCLIAGVSRSGYYRWLDAEETRRKREEADRKDFELILTVYKKRGYNKGIRSIHMGLLHMEPPVVMNLKKIQRLMNKYKLKCPIRKANPYRRMARALKTNNVAEYILKRRFTDYGPRMVLLTDITYIPYNGVFAYLSTIIDAYTRQVLSYVVSDSLEIDFVLQTVELLMEKHGVDLNEETIINSDQGCHYTSYKFIQIIKDAGIRQSMSHKGNCWDNAPQESFFGHMKDEIDVSMCTMFNEVKAIIDDWMDYYNNERYQWQLAKLSPNEFYNFYVTGIYPINIDNQPQIEQYKK